MLEINPGSISREPELLAIPGGSELKSLADRAEVVSFDFFDTLFIRAVPHPENVFDILGHQLGINRFRDLRIAAQAEAFRKMQLAGRKEILLQEIYESFSWPGIDFNDLAQAEYDLEQKLLEPNPEIFPYFKHLVASGKSVVITSDMYFQERFFQDVLLPYGLETVPLFISSDRNATKRDAGELFDLLISQLGLKPEQILHIGDSELGDWTRAKEKGLLAFHYNTGPASQRPTVNTISVSHSVSHGLLKTRGTPFAENSYAGLGYLYGGPATVGFYEWIAAKTKEDRVDKVLFLSRDGYSLERYAQTRSNRSLPDSCYFLGSRIAYTLAAITDENFAEFLPFLLSASDGLAPFELLERIGVPSPSPKFFADLDLADSTIVQTQTRARLEQFLFAYRWEILKVCRRNRNALFQYLSQAGLRSGQRVALVDVGWRGATQEAFELAIAPMIDLEVFGYYFCLADGAERERRQKKHRMAAMFASNTVPGAKISAIYHKRVTVELFFSAPHHTVIGLELDSHGDVRPVLDPGRGKASQNLEVIQEICQGIEAYCGQYRELFNRLDLELTPAETAAPLIDLVTTSPNPQIQPLIDRVHNFDAWASSKNSSS
jgi:FMN phosphatase YigB (HAD superfamily)